MVWMAAAGAVVAVGWAASVLLAAARFRAVNHLSRASTPPGRGSMNGGSYDLADRLR